LDHREPPGYDPRQPVSFEAIDGAAAVASHADDAGSFQNVQVPGGGGPAVREPLGQISGGQLGSEVRQKMHDVPAGLVRERLEHAVDFLRGNRKRGSAWDDKIGGHVHDN